MRLFILLAVVYFALFLIAPLLYFVLIRLSVL